MSIKTDMLFIRACKLNNSIIKINKLYKRFYYNNHIDKIEYGSIAMIFLDITEKYYPINFKNLAFSLNPKNAIYNVNNINNYSYEELLTMVLMSHLRYVDTNIIKDYLIPIKYKKDLYKSLQTV